MKAYEHQSGLEQDIRLSVKGQHRASEENHQLSGAAGSNSWAKLDGGCSDAVDSADLKDHPIDRLMATPEELATQLAKVFALTEIFPLRHSNVQEALDSFVGAAEESGLSLEVQDDVLLTSGVPVDEASSDVADLTRGMARCGLRRLDLDGGIEARVVGSFLDALRIASISGHTANLREMVSFHSDLTADFEDEDPILPRLAEPAGAIFAAALGGTDDQGPVSIGNPTEVASDVVAGGAAEDEPTDWDPPGVAAVTEEPPEAKDGVSGPAAESAEEEEARPEGQVSHEPSVEGRHRDGMSPDEFRVGLELFLEGSPSEQRSWAPALAGQAARVTVSDDPGKVLDLIALVLDGEAEPEPHLCAICNALAGPEVMRALAHRLSDAEEEDTRGDMLSLTVSLGEVAAPALADVLMESSDRGARRALVHALSSQGSAALDTVLSMLADPRWYVVRNAVTVLGAIGTSANVPHLETALAHADGRVRREAVMALAKLGGPGAQRFLVGMLDDHDSDVRAAAIMVAGILKVEDARPRLCAQLGDEENEDVLIEILRTLGLLKDTSAVELIRPKAVLSFFSRPAKAVRIAAFRALGQIGTPEALRLLEDALEDRDADVRNAAQLALDSQG